MSTTASRRIDSWASARQWLADRQRLQRDLASAFFDAMVTGSPQMVRAMIAAGAAVNGRNRDKETPLLLAIHSKRPVSVVRALLDGGAKVDAADGEGNTPLIAAADDALFPVARVLIERGADVDACNDDGDTPLTNAAAWGSARVVGLLLKHNADPRRPDGAKLMPHDLAQSQGHTQLAARLRKAAGL